MKKIILFLFLSTLLAGIACSHHKIEYRPGELSAKSVSPTGNLSADVVWMKNKKDTVDLLLMLTNTSKSSVFLRSSFRLYFNNTEGVRYTNDMPEEIPSGAAPKGLLVFRFDTGKPMAGTVKLVIDPIYADADGKNKLPPITLERAVR
jgi:hypothetical protein